MKIFSFFLFSIVLLTNDLSAQQSSEYEILAPDAQWVVMNHKDQLKLTLIIDSIQVGNKVYALDFQKTLNLNFETDYLHVKDDIYIRIFISRNQEYGKKFYSWKWDYLIKKGNSYRKLCAVFYEPMNFNQPITGNGNYGQGTGNEGEASYLMFYYRYKLE